MRHGFAIPLLPMLACAAANRRRAASASGQNQPLYRKIIARFRVQQLKDDAIDSDEQSPSR